MFKVLKDKNNQTRILYPAKLPLKVKKMVVQGLRICLPMQGTQVRSLVQEDPTCHGATKPVRHNY